MLSNERRNKLSEEGSGVPGMLFYMGWSEGDFTDELTCARRIEGEGRGSNAPIWESPFQAKEGQGAQSEAMESVRGQGEMRSSKEWVAGREIKQQRGRITG